MAHILILNGSMRKNGNTALLVQQFAEGAAQHHSVEIVSVSDYHVNPCIGCNSCFAKTDHRCFQNDDMAQIYEKMQAADIVIIASPVYFYGISAELKAIVDRLHNPIRNSFHMKKLGLLLVGAASLTNLFDPILLQYQMVLDYFKLESIGTVLVRGVNAIGEIKSNPALQEAYALGASV